MINESIDDNIHALNLRKKYILPIILSKIFLIANNFKLRRNDKNIDNKMCYLYNFNVIF